MDMLQSQNERDCEQKIRNEIAEVRRQLFAALLELSSPLGELVRSQLEHSLADWRIGLVLVAAQRAEATDYARQQRILLSSALEMLQLALRIHKLLLAYPQNHGSLTLERTWSGTVILAGDYCFSRSASLAAQTDLPRVVDIFAQALKTVSEELLRWLFAPNEQAVVDIATEELELITAGLCAATVIAAMDDKSAQATVEYGQKLFKRLALLATPSSPADLPVTLTAFQRPYWQALLTLYPSAQINLSG